MTRRGWTLAYLVTPFLALILLAVCTPPSDAYAAEDPGLTAIVAVHGGGWYSGTPAKMDAVCADFTALGYDCFQPSYTLSGVSAFNIANAELRDYVFDLRLQGYTRIVGIGASAGGNLVGWLASHDYLDAAVTLSAPTKLPGLVDWWRAQCSCWVVNQFAPTPTKRQNASPALDTVTIPILILHSQDEPLIPVLQAHRLADVSTQATLTILPGTRHAMAYWSEVSPQVAAWIGGLA